MDKFACSGAALHSGVVLLPGSSSSKFWFQWSSLGKAGQRGGRRGQGAVGGGPGQDYDHHMPSGRSTGRALHAEKPSVGPPGGTLRAEKPSVVLPFQAMAAHHGIASQFMSNYGSTMV